MLQNQALLHFAEPIRDKQELLDTPQNGNSLVCNQNRSAFVRSCVRKNLPKRTVKNYQTRCKIPPDMLSVLCKPKLCQTRWYKSLSNLTAFRFMLENFPRISQSPGLPIL
jgi:hypothetical protein